MLLWLLVLFPEAMSAIAESNPTPLSGFSKDQMLAIGSILLLGFSVMILVDEAVSKMFKESLQSFSYESGSTQVSVATYGMCIHSAAEGLSLGASLYCKFKVVHFCSEFVWSRFAWNDRCFRYSLTQGT